MSPRLLCPPIEKADDSSGREQCMSSGLKANFETLKKRKMDDASAKKVAEETACLVQSEIQKMLNSVAELEAMLKAREGDVDDDDFESENDDDEDYDDDDDKVDDLPAKNPFPILPPEVIAIPDTGFVRSDDGDDSSIDELESDTEADGKKGE